MSWGGLSRRSANVGGVKAGHVTLPTMARAYVTCNMYMQHVHVMSYMSILSGSKISTKLGECQSGTKRKIPARSHLVHCRRSAVACREV